MADPPPTLRVQDRAPVGRAARPHRPGSPRADASTAGGAGRARRRLARPDAVALLKVPPRATAARVLVFSALFGVVRLTDRIPAYRLAGSAALPGVRGLGAHWRRRLTVLDDDDDVGRGLVVDCRSASYTTIWRPAGAVPVRVFREHDGERTVVSHMAKHARGLVARALVQAPEAPRNLGDAVDVLTAWFGTHPVRTATGQEVAVRVEGSAGALDVITTWLAVPAATS